MRKEVGDLLKKYGGIVVRNFGDKPEDTEKIM